MNKFDGAGSWQNLLRFRAKSFGGGNYKDGSESFAAGEKAVPDSAANLARAGGWIRDVIRKSPVNHFFPACEVIFCVH